uniref:Uncharacterized protein n=1 Tax=Timema genevievae TaxID=629358 RepID=A0A7R9JWY7_TIMGE|nr:unnamed protein product [Timema genevievae]
MTDDSGLHEGSSGDYSPANTSSGGASCPQCPVVPRCGLPTTPAVDWAAVGIRHSQIFKSSH